LDFQNKVKTYEYKTVRYPGHYEKIKCMMDLGLLDLEPVEVKDSGGEIRKIAPREIFHAVVPPRIDFPEDKDLVVLRATCRGRKNGKAMEVQFELIDFQDEATGFTAMERGTGFPAAEVLIHAAEGHTKKGVVPLEVALNNENYLNNLKTRELKITEDVRS
jgi:lysine 6-dehydrogenase